jgi:hypothetical protein
VRNRLPAPVELDVLAMREGQAPLNPAEYCRDPRPGPPLDQSTLRVIWLEECDAAALVENDETLAIIPSWSGEQGFEGYARDAVGTGPLAWELAPDNDMHARVQAAGEFWLLWDDDDFWTRWRDERAQALEARLGPHAKHYAIDGGEFPPKALYRFDLPDRYVFVTLGMSLFCQPRVERHFDDPSPYRRIELAAALSRECTDKELNKFGRYLSAQTRYPWSQFTWLGFGHTLPCDSTPASCGGAKFPAVALAQSLPGVGPLELPSFRGDPTNVLWFYSITDAEWNLAMEQSTDRLMELLFVAGHDGVIRKRKSVVE